MYYLNKKVPLVSYRYVRTRVSRFDTNETLSDNTSVTKISPSVGDYATDTRSGVSVPDYKARIARKLDASSGYAIVKQEYNPSEGSTTCSYVDFSNRTKTETWSWGALAYLPSVATSSSLYDAALDAKACTSFLSNLANKQRTFTGGVFAGELRETIHSIRHPLQGLYNGFWSYLKAMRRRKATGRQALAIMNRAAANTWLEFQYGWRPLVMDLKGAMQALADFNYRSPVERISGFAKAEYALQGSQTSFAADTYLTYTWKPLSKQETTVRYTGGMNALCDGVGAVTQHFGVDLASFVPTVWELLPYSFLVDYFVNVGDILNACSANTSQLYYCDKSIAVHNQTIMSNVVAVDNLASGTYSVKRLQASGSIGSPASSYVAYNRSIVSPGSLAPSLRFYVPGDYSLRWANMAALIMQGKAVSNFLTH